MKGPLKTQLELTEEISALKKRIQELERSEEDLRLSREQLRLLLNVGPDFFFLKDLDLRYQLVNAANARFFGRDEAHILGRTDTEFMSPDAARACQESDMLAIRNKKMVVTTESVWGRFYETHKFPVFVAGEIVGVAGIIRDVTERREGEEALRESERRFRSLVETTSDWVWEVDSDGFYTYSSPKVKDLLGYEPEDVIGKRPVDLMPKKEADRIGSLLREIVESQRSFSGLENVNLHRDGREIVLESSGEPIADAQGNFLGFRGIDRDITERKHGEAALRRSEERYRSIFENSPLGIFQSTFEGRFLRANPALAVILGYESPGELIDSVSDIAQQVYASPEDRAPILRHMRENDGRTIYENEYVRKDGGKGIGRLTMRIINDENGAPHHLDGTVEDVTEKRMTEERLQRTMEQLRTLSHRLLEIQEMERRSIARELHDEIGQNLTALRIGLKRTERSKTLESALALLHESTPTVEELISQVRNLSIELRPSILDDFGLIAALEWYVNWLSAKVGFRVIFHADFPEKRFSPILELTCFRITQEALTNAARHSSAKIVYVDLETLSGELHLTVRDEGKGFDVDKTHKRALKGESFGLLGMQERASLAGGRLEFTSRPGKGTVIHAFFPLGTGTEDPITTSTDN